MSKSSTLVMTSRPDVMQLLFFSPHRKIQTDQEEREKKKEGNG